MRPFERLLPPKSSVWFQFDQPPFAGPLRYAQGVPKTGLLGSGDFSALPEVARAE
jgi:hypothetical protein